MEPDDGTNSTNGTNGADGTSGADNRHGTNDATTRNQYRRTAGYQMDERTLLLRGGVYDGRHWVGVVKVGQRVFCGGDDAWSTEGIYVVTDRVEKNEDGDEANIAVPAFA